MEWASRLERLALTPQCGFSTSIVGNQIGEECQFAKLRRIAETAGEIWGRPSRSTTPAGECSRAIDSGRCLIRYSRMIRRSCVAPEDSDLDRTTYPPRCSRKKPIVRFHASAAAASL